MLRAAWPAQAASIDRAANLKEPFTAKQVQGHLRWMYTWGGGPLEIDGQRSAAKAAEPKVKTAEPKVKAEPKAKTKVAAAAVKVEKRTRTLKRAA